MAKITIDIPDDTAMQLKIYALQNGRSYSKFLPRYLRECVKNTNIIFNNIGDFTIVAKSQNQKEE